MGISAQELIETQRRSEDLKDSAFDQAMQV